MSIISRFFGSKKKDGYNDKPPIYGGDGLSDTSPVIINCSSMSMAQALIDSFISKQYGNGWERVIEFTIANPNDTNKPLKLIRVKTADGNEHKLYFDLSSPVVRQKQ